MLASPSRTRPRPAHLWAATHATAGADSESSAELAEAILTVGGAGPRRPRRGWSATPNQEAALHDLAALARDYAGAGARENGVITPEQVWNGRRLLRWSRERLAAESGTSVHAVQQYEVFGRMAKQYWDKADTPPQRFRAALDASGVVFTPDSEPKVRLRRRGP